jgi:prenyltransferase beta subunit
MKTLCLLSILCVCVHAQEAARLRTQTVRLAPGAREAINNGLEWLAKEQHDDGSFGNQSHLVADTSLALMAFMLPGHVPGRGRYGKAMNDAITYLINHSQAQRGYLGTPDNHAGMYEHGLAVLALSEAWGQSKNGKIRDTLRRAVDVILRAQNSEGGWRYNPEPRDADLSMTVMHIVALNSAKEAGISVPDTTIRRATEYVLACQNENNGGFAYTQRDGQGQPGFARTAAGVMSLIMCGQRRHPATRRGMAYLKAYPENKFGYKFPRFHYAHYYAIQCMYQFGEAEFSQWYPKVSAAIIEAQSNSGSWSSSHGDHFGTPMSILILGVPYRYLPIYQR